MRVADELPVTVTLLRPPERETAMLRLLWRENGRAGAS